MSCQTRTCRELCRCLACWRLDGAAPLLPLEIGQVYFLPSLKGHPALTNITWVWFLRIGGHLTGLKLDHRFAISFKSDPSQVKRRQKMSLRGCKSRPEWLLTLWFPGIKFSKYSQLSKSSTCLEISNGFLFLYVPGFIAKPRAIDLDRGILWVPQRNTTMKQALS